MRYTITIPKNVLHFQGSIETLLDRLFAYKVTSQDEVLVDIAHTTFLSSELTAVVSAVVNRWIKMGVQVYIHYSATSSLSRQLQKNGFFSLFINKPTTPDVFDTVIPLYQGNSQDNEGITKYLNDYVFSHSHWPRTVTTISHEIESINSAIFEIALNIHEHSGANTLHMCGQFYPRKRQLCFALVDSGRTIPKNIRIHRPNLFTQSDQDLIEWATEKGHSTKKTAASGMGLFEIRSSILGHGELTVISNCGYWRQAEGGKIVRANMRTPFPGTAIHLLFDFRKPFDSQHREQNNDIIAVDELTF